MSEQHTYTTLMETFLLLDDGDHRVLARFGLNPTQFTTLGLLDRSAGMRASELTGPLLLEKSSISRMLERLVREGLIDRTNDPDDRRAQLLTLTSKGQTILRQAQHAHDRSIQKRLAALSAHEHAQITSLLYTLNLHLRTTLDQDA